MSTNELDNGSRAAAFGRVAVAPLVGFAAYVTAYGSSIQTSVDVLLHGYGSSATPHRRPELTDARVLALESCLLAVALVLASVAVNVVGAPQREWLIGTTPARRGRAGFTVGALMLSDLAGYYIVRATGAGPGPVDPVHHALWVELVQGLSQGALGEELLVLALPVILVRRAAPQLLERRGSLVVVLVGGVALRLAYHLYQGVWSLSHLPWAAIAILLYLWSGRVWPQILAHAAYDGIVVLANHGAISGALEVLALVVVPLGLVGLGASLIVRRRSRERVPGS